LWRLAIDGIRRSREESRESKVDAAVAGREMSSICDCLDQRP
jgi:hypothetical protein